MNMSIVMIDIGAKDELTDDIDESIEYEYEISKQKHFKPALVIVLFGIENQMDFIKYSIQNKRSMKTC